jgi:hypothetical protein
MVGTLAGNVAAMADFIGLFPPLTQETHAAARRHSLGRAHWSRGRGRCRIGEHSGLRKLMRAANRGLVPSERLRVIVQAMRSAQERAHVYQNSSRSA